MKNKTLIALSTCTILAFSATNAFAENLNCANLSVGSLGQINVEITGTAVTPKGEDSPLDHCIIHGSIDNYTGTDGQAYSIDFELRLPDSWNGSFVHQFNGGNDGSVGTALGTLMFGGNALSRGYAVISSNAGHDGSARRDAGLAGGARFGFDLNARKNYGYTTVAKLNPIAEQIIEKYYDKKIEYTYGVGGSNGGRHAMIAASRMPKDFDGLLVGYPGFNLPKAAIQHAWDVQHLKTLTGDIRTSFTRDELKFVSEQIVSACDALDGIGDGIISNSNLCQTAFKPDSMICEAGQNSACLSEAKVAVLKALHDGPTNSAGEQLYSDWAWDSGIGTDGWRTWKLESSIPPFDNMPLIATMGSASLAQIFTTPPVEVGGSPDDLEKYLLDFNFDVDAPKIFATSEIYSESPMDVMTPPGSDNPKLSEFREKGGKMIIAHGISDPVFSINDTTNWYEKLDENSNGNAKSFVKYYQIPGMPHGGGGASTDRFEAFSALVAWVEKGVEPASLKAKSNPENPDAKGLAGITRLLCPYPLAAQYKDGDPKSSNSFFCK
ncbi:MAG: tannase/feruloyl esterase family alpha/beta hydrolase [Alphaproteobacteria bacterium]|nr:tannase/feruloyl esterase family alpha/beta hydrolase [Alphaproteobacteria bacterium]